MEKPKNFYDNPGWIDYFFKKEYPTDKLFKLSKDSFSLYCRHNDKYHRLFGPAIAYITNYCFYKNGSRHRLNAPANRSANMINYYEFDEFIKQEKL